MSNTHSKLLTCRYWALGPACPNIDEHGIITCDYAHWDTGTLANFHQQRGTCAWWASGTCRNGQQCYYEHRFTGMPVIQLHGVNLEIADAANRAGFNTFNHEALMNLIWSVKRVMRRPGRGSSTAVLRDPVYPDRYRPSGVGDNTKRKRYTTSSGSSPPPFYPIRPLGKNKSRNKARFNGKAMKDIDYIALSRVRGGRVSKKDRQNLPVRPKHEEMQTESTDLLSSHDDDRLTAANISAKRQKIDTTLVGGHRTEGPQADVTVPNMLLDTVPVDRNRENTTLELTTILRAVQGTLEQAKKSMAQCQRTMKDLFQCNNIRLGEDGIFPLMTSLSREIYRAHDGARDGITDIDKSVNWLQDEDRYVAK